METWRYEECPVCGTSDADGYCTDGNCHCDKHIHYGCDCDNANNTVAGTDSLQEEVEK